MTCQVGRRAERRQASPADVVADRDDDGRWARRREEGQRMEVEDNSLSITCPTPPREMISHYPSKRTRLSREGARSEDAPICLAFVGAC